MRAISFLAFCSLLSFNFVSAAVSSHHEARALIPTVDVCANVDINVLTALGLVDLTDAGLLEACLCVSTVRQYIQANILLETVAQIVGETAVVNLLLNTINSQGQNCMYPPHATPFCMANAPCDFGCGDGYTKMGVTCICPAPNIECNDVCQSQACSSSLPHKRSIDPPNLRSRMRILTDERCSRGQRLCGGGGTRRRGVEDWECIDTRSTLDSCGGCMYHYTLDDRPVDGSDCSSLPGVSGVECRAGRCHVHRCKRGWKVAPSETECIPDTVTSP